MIRRRRRSIIGKTAKAINRSTRAMKLEVDVPVSREIISIIYILFVVLTFLGLKDLAGPIGGGWITFLKTIVGIWGVYFFMILLFLLALFTFFIKAIELNFTRVFGISLLLLSCLGCVYIYYTPLANESNVANFGGYLGFTVGELIKIAFSEATIYILIAMILIGVVITFGCTLKDVLTVIKFRHKPTFDNSQEGVSQTGTSHGDTRINSRQISIEEGVAKKDDFKVHTTQTTLLDKKDLAKIDLAIRKDKMKQTTIDINTTIDENYKWEFPSIDLLDNPDNEVSVDEKFLKLNARKIEEKLLQFGIKVKVKDVKVGPTVMQYSVLPAEDVKLSKITALRNDLKLALAAESLRIEAPIPGKSLVGIEIPNEKRTNVRLKELLLSENFYKVKSNLRIPLGKDVSGAPIIADLTNMPHLLMAGQTGSGKSVGINAILISLLYQNSPRDLRLILIDPKRVELKIYNHIPHLLTPVINEVDKAINALKWCVAEMMRRYGELESMGARNRLEYNEKVAKDKKMSVIVCVIDELSELMMAGDKKAIEGYICRVAQLARAVGIHLIVATQRPSVDVITGLIKANIPARIGFRVAQAVDSRTILDMIGAEDLLGKGDMLYISGSTSEPLRIQGVFMPTSEVERVVNKIKLSPTELSDVQYVDEITDPQEESTLKGSIFEGEEGDEDVLLKQAIELLSVSGKGSTSLLQRRLKIGYARAARILDILEDKGIVGPADGSKPRKVYLDAISHLGLNVSSSNINLDHEFAPDPEDHETSIMIEREER